MEGDTIPCFGLQKYKGRKLTDYWIYQRCLHPQQTPENEKPIPDQLSSFITNIMR